MPILSNQTDSFYRLHFIFSGNDILITGNPKEDTFLTPQDLPDKEIFRRCLSAQIASDWYAEPELDYSAMMLEKDAPVPEGCSLIPLRLFFWLTKTKEQQHGGMPSLAGGLAARAHGFLRLREQYRFCPSCGTKLEVHAVEVAKVCPKCGRLDFPRIEPAIIVLVSKGDEVLLVKNRNRSYNFFGCVSGFVEHGETIEQCVYREVLEETGITVQDIRYAGSQSWPFPDQLMLAFTATYKSGELKLQDSELEDGGWFRKDSLPEIPKEGSVAYNLIMGYFKGNTSI